MSGEQICPRCGAPLCSDGPAGNCPTCLLALAAALAPENAPAPVEPLGQSAKRQPPPTVGRRPTLRYFGDYELIEEIARGGMGIVYRARQVSLNRVVAVKLLPFGPFASDEFVKRFRAEAEAAANLQHPNIVAIHEVGEHEGQHYFSMDHVDGQNLADCARENPLPPELAADYLKVIAEAIHYAHQRGILHRDLKPSNILIDASGQPRITDFGLAKRLTDSELGTHNSELTMSGQVLGTPSFMSPEQAHGRAGAVTVASDVYSLGALLYFVLTGFPPFLADTLEQTLRQVHEHDPVSPRLRNPAITRDLETLCLKCLEKDPARRYATARELAEELGRFLANEPIHARPVSPLEKLWRWCWRKPALAALVAAVHLVGAAGLGGILWQWHRAETNLETVRQQSLRVGRLAARETAQRQRAEEAVTMLELQRAEDLLAKDETVLGVAHLARIVRQEPTNRIAAQRLLSALTQRTFALPVGARLQHAGRLRAVEFSPDGRRVVTGSADFTARVWEAATGAPFTGPLLHPGAVRAARFSPDGGRLVTVADDFKARLWEVASGQRLGQSAPHAGRIGTVQFSPDGDRFVTASEDRTARIWDARSGKPVLAPLEHAGPVRWARFSPDGRRIVTASTDKTARVWNAQTAEPVSPPFVHLQAVDKAEFSPDGKWVVTVAKDFSTCVWDVASGRPVAPPLIHGAELDTAVFTPEGERIITASHDGSVSVWNVRNWKLVAGPMRHRGWVTAVEPGPEGQRILTGSGDNTARLWDAVNGQALSAPLQHDGLVLCARFSPDGMFAVTGSADKTARIWDLRLGGALHQRLRHEASVRAAEFSPDGEWIVTASLDSTARLWSVRTGQPGLTLKHAQGVLAVQFSPDGQRLATASSDRTARVWDARTGAPLTEPLRHGAPVDGVQFSPDGRTLATSSKSDANVRLWSVATGMPAAEPIRHHSTNVHVLRFSPDGRLLVTDEFQSNLGLVWDVQTGRLLLELNGHDGYLRHGEFSPDGQWVLTASEDGSARLWNVRTGQSRIRPLRHNSGLNQARFSRDGRWLVTASEDHTAQVWEVQTGQPMGEPLRHRGPVKAAEFSPDGLLVVTASEDGTARVWDARTGRSVAEPFQHSGKVRSARFSPDGRRVLTACDDGASHLWEVPPAIGGAERLRSVPLSPDKGEGAREAEAGDTAFAGVLLADLAEAVLGRRVNAQGGLESVSSPRLDQVRQRVASLPRDDDFTRWLEWFLADRSTRPISPGSTVTVPVYIDTETRGTNEAAWHKMLQLCPTNGFTFAWLVDACRRRGGTDNAATNALLDWMSAQAVRLAPWHDLAWNGRKWVCERTHAWGQLLAEAERGIAQLPTSPYPWNAKAHALEQLGQPEAMLAAADRAVELWEAAPSLRWDRPFRWDSQHKRAIALQALGRSAEAAAANAASHGLTPRSPAAGSNLVNLDAYYTGGEDMGFPGKVARLAGTDFDFRGWIHLDMKQHRPEIRHLPERVDGIPIEQRCRRLHFLQTASFASHRTSARDGPPREIFDAPLGATVGRYVIHYADGQQAEVPILHGRDVRDYFHTPDSAPDDPALVVAWTAVTDHSRKYDAVTRLYKQTWANPRPDVPIRSLDFIHGKTHAVPILVALTAEP